MSVLVRVLQLESHLHVAFHQVPMFADHRSLSNHPWRHVYIALVVCCTVLRGGKLRWILRIAESISCEIRPKLRELTWRYLWRNLNRRRVLVRWLLSLDTAVMSKHREVVINRGYHRLALICGDHL